MLNEILQKLGLKFEDLNSAEQETLRGWLEIISKQELSVEKIKEYIKTMLSGVEKELSEDKLPKWKDVFLKARMRNYLLLVDFLESPGKAKEALEKAIGTIKK